MLLHLPKTLKWCCAYESSCYWHNRPDARQVRTLQERSNTTHRSGDITPPCMRARMHLAAIWPACHQQTPDLLFSMWRPFGRHATSRHLMFDISGMPVQEAEFERLVNDVWGTHVKVEVLMHVLGLVGCRNTVVGGPLLRGISGGEQKRVTSAEHLMGPKVRSGTPQLGCLMRAGSSLLWYSYESFGHVAAMLPGCNLPGM